MQTACLLLLCLVTVRPLPAGEMVETSVIAFQIRGKKPYEKTQIRDLDILVVDDSTRSLPLRRLLKTFELSCDEVGDSLVFRTARGQSCALAPATAQLRSDSGITKVDLTYGISDVTGQTDYYLPEPVIERILDAKLDWNETDWAYTGETQSSFPAWKGIYKSGKKADRGSPLKSLGVELPELLPPAGPSALGDPSLHFIQPGLAVNQNSRDRLTTQRTLEAHGRLVRGRYGFRVRQSTGGTNSQVVLDQVSLTHRLGDIETAAGDVEFGLNDFVFPSLRLLGAEANGLLGLDTTERDDDRSDFGKNDRYLSRMDYRGVAPLGSTVELYVGNRFVAEQLVTEPSGGAGEGIYRFESVNLARDRVTELKFVITEPDGKVTERFEEAVGSTSLLQAGQTAFIAGTGVRRFTAPDFWYTQGQFYGGRVQRGITPFWTLGLAGAYQDRFSVPYNLDEYDSSRSEAVDQYPVWSRHAGFESRFRLMRRYILSADVAVTESEYQIDSLTRRTSVSADSGYSYRLALDAHPLNGLKLQPQLFRLSPGFFDGVNVTAQDREGYVLGARLMPLRGLVFNLVHGSVHNNLVGAGPTRWERWEHADFNVPRIIPRSSLRVNLERLTVGGDDFTGSRGPWHLAHFTLHSTLLRVAELNGQFTFGDERMDAPAEDLRRGLALPNASPTFRQQWTVTLGRKLMKNGWLNVGHNRSQFRERTELTHILRATDKSPWQWRLDCGWDWMLEDPYLQVQPEYFFERSGTSRITTMARLQDGEWVFAVGIQLQPIISLVGGRPFLIAHSRLNPASGGVKGVVFLDENGNGRREDAEPGVPGIAVMAEGGRRATTGKHGEFVLGGSTLKRRVKVSLDGRSLSASYSATNGQQWAWIEPGSLTPIELGIVEPGSISGTVVGPDPMDSTKTKTLDGVRVVARDAAGVTKGESVTSSDGTFWIGGLVPGDYLVTVDPATLLKGYSPGDATQTVAVRGGDGGELDVTDVTLTLNYERPGDGSDPRQ